MSFIHDDFMLHSTVAKRLYHEFAEGLPIIDYHCHLPVQKIAENHRFADAFELFLGGDHYKWRLMRTNGIGETYITGEADGYEKWLAFCRTLPLAVGNPLYHWTHLELKRYFGVDELLSEKNAKAVWDHIDAMLKRPEFSARGLIRQSNVEVVCTTDAPGDTLEHHEKLQDFEVRVVPAFRPDLSKVTPGLTKDMDFFHDHGCRLSDHAVDAIDDETVEKLIFLGREYASRGRVKQLHFGALRNNNRRMFEKLGPDTGFDSIHDFPLAAGLAKILDGLEREDLLPKTILYCLNPKDNHVLGTMLGCFQKGPARGKIQFGSGWWFNDQRDGMQEQMKALANLGMLSSFVGMLTDSRSFVSYPRHEYFRRILCDLLGSWVERGEYPEDYALLGQSVRGICYQNAKDYFAF
ncbi:MAG: glucuronate isomerase [Oscillospiraceae bacterium]|nr:glucuronate isomerase [Oscillospiraceae bacterium]